MYSLEGMMINEFGGVTVRCDNDELIPPSDIAISEYQGSQVYSYYYSFFILLLSYNFISFA